MGTRQFASLLRAGRFVQFAVEIVYAMIAYADAVPLEELPDLIGSVSAEATPRISKQFIQISFRLSFSNMRVHPPRR